MIWLAEVYPHGRGWWRGPTLTREEVVVPSGWTYLGDTEAGKLCFMEGDAYEIFVPPDTSYWIFGPYEFAESRAKERAPA